MYVSSVNSCPNFNSSLSFNTDIGIKLSLNDFKALDTNSDADDSQKDVFTAAIAEASLLSCSKSEAFEEPKAAVNKIENNTAESAESENKSSEAALHSAVIENAPQFILMEDISLEPLQAAEKDTEASQNTDQSAESSASGAGEAGVKVTVKRSVSAKSSRKSSEPAGELEEEALRKELEQQDRLRAAEIYERMEVERRIHEAKRMAVLADLQTELQKIWREAVLRRKKVEDDLNKAWQKVFLGSS